MTNYVCATIVALVFGVACSGSDVSYDALDASLPDVIEIDNEVRNGSSTKDYPWVVRIPNCSAFAVTDNVLFTAAHCLFDAAGAIQVHWTNPPTGVLQKLYDGAAKKALYTTAQSYNSERDIAVIVLSGAGLNKNLQAPIYSGSWKPWQLTTCKAFRGLPQPQCETYSVVGYGLTGVDECDQPFGSKNIGTLQFRGQTVGRGGPTDVPLIQGRSYPSHTCPGDSGTAAVYKGYAFGIHLGKDSSGQYAVETNIRLNWSWLTSAASSLGKPLSCASSGGDLYTVVQGRSVLTGSTRHLRCAD
jgi:hypothetical protein